MNDIPLKMIEGEFEREDQDTLAPVSGLVLDEQGQPKPKMLRVMTADQVRERVDLQVSRTTEYLHRCQVSARLRDVGGVQRSNGVKYF